MNGTMVTDDEARVRALLHAAVDDVEPRPDALPRLLAATRRHRSPRRRVLLGAGSAVAATAALLLVLVVFPTGQRTAPVSIGPHGYLAITDLGVVSVFDVDSGQRQRELGRVDGGAAGPVAGSPERFFALVDGHVVAGGADGELRRLPGTATGQVLTAEGDRVAYLDGGAVVVADPAQRRVPIPPGTAVLDLALAEDGRLAVLLADPAGDVGIRVLPAGAADFAAAGEIDVLGDCGPLSVTWTGGDVAALLPVSCGSADSRVATFDAETGRRLGGGVAFETGPLHPGSVQLSTDRLGRFLVSTAGTGQWLVDGGLIRPLPPACAPGGQCAQTPSSF
ncbi:hypothetical protein [Saccharopolyspora cebuensis]|uniref:FbpC C-terminal regulatory nucleotide binding domain-containing protein n=1 Tax=Saccharopolyspora cebuensis TaxID=418759 RepID=A0ABV4CF39_9PSEU